jgi:pSer/pThr/pTyr-binding forkhead associated (FHA) protein
MTDIPSSKLAKVVWSDPISDVVHEHVLTEGATATIGRSSSNDITVPDQHVSRQHAVITFRDGGFVITDLGSANGTFVNDRRIDESCPLVSGDVIRLYLPTLSFSASVSPQEFEQASQTGSVSVAAVSGGQGELAITNGPQEGEVIVLRLQELTIGRATSSATWEIGLRDPSVSRPHARMICQDGQWLLYDLGSVNGTFVNRIAVGAQGYPLRDGDVIAFGATLALFRSG